jgi:hypothetical protein
VVKRLASIVFLLAICAVARGQIKADSFLQWAAYPCASTSALSAITLCGWVDFSPKASGNSDAPTMVSDYQYQVNKRSFVFMWYHNKIEVRLGAGGGTSWQMLCITNSISDATGIKHYAFSWSSGERGTIYINGRPATNAYTGSFTNISSLVVGTRTWFGMYNNDVELYYGPKYLHDCRVYSRALSAQEISEIYARPWSLADDPALVLRTCIVTNDTGTALTGVARNLGTGADGTYSNAPTVAPGKIQTSKPLTMELP